MRIRVWPTGYWGHSQTSYSWPSKRRADTSLPRRFGWSGPPSDGRFWSRLRPSRPAFPRSRPGPPPCGKAAVLIPLSHAIYRHQERDAQVMESGGAAVVLSQENLTGLELAQTIETLLRDPGRLRAMGALSRVLGRVDSAERMVRECQALVARKAKGEGAQPRACSTMSRQIWP